MEELKEARVEYYMVVRFKKNYGNVPWQERIVGCYGLTTPQTNAEAKEMALTLIERSNNGLPEGHACTKELIRVEKHIVSVEVV